MNADDAVIGGDWGTTNLRLYWIDRRRKEIVASVSSDCGVKQLAGQPEKFSTILAEQCRVLIGKVGATGVPEPILISGMTSSSIGWSEIPYGTLPFDLSSASLPHRQVRSADGCTVILYSGIAGDLDVMRGEECECIGLHALLGNRAPARYRVVLPGTHSKHVTVEQGQIVGFNTYLGGELFAILTEHSILRMSVNPDGDSGEDTDVAAFTAGVRAGAKGNLIGQLFKVRAKSLLQGAPPSECRDWLSGLLIGSELKDIADTDPTIPIFCLGASRLRSHYATAAKTLGLKQWNNLTEQQMVDIRARLYLQLAAETLG